MLSIFIDALLISFMAALIAVVYKEIIGYEDFFNFWWRFGSRYEDRWFYAPIWGCSKCLAGELSFVAYVLVKISFVLPRHLTISGLSVHLQGYSLFGHIFAVAAAIYFTFIVTSIFQKTKQ